MLGGKGDMSVFLSSLESLIREVAEVLVGCHSVLGGISRELRFSKIKLEIEHIRNFLRVFNRSFVISQEALHLDRVFEVELVRFKSDRAALRYNVIRLDAHQHRVRLGVRFSYIVDVVRCNHRDSRFL